MEAEVGPVIFKSSQEALNRTSLVSWMGDCYGLKLPLRGLGAKTKGGSTLERSIVSDFISSCWTWFWGTDLLIISHCDTLVRSKQKGNSQTLCDEDTIAKAGLGPEKAHNVVGSFGPSYSSDFFTLLLLVGFSGAF